MALMLEGVLPRRCNYYKSEFLSRMGKWGRISRVGSELKIPMDAGVECLKIVGRRKDVGGKESSTL